MSHARVHLLACFQPLHLAAKPASMCPQARGSSLSSGVILVSHRAAQSWLRTCQRAESRARPCHVPRHTPLTSDAWPRAAGCGAWPWRSLPRSAAQPLRAARHPARPATTSHTPCLAAPCASQPCSEVHDAADGENVWWRCRTASCYATNGCVHWSRLCAGTCVPPNAATRTPARYQVSEHQHSSPLPAQWMAMPAGCQPVSGRSAHDTQPSQLVCKPRRVCTRTRRPAGGPDPHDADVDWHQGHCHDA